MREIVRSGSGSTSWLLSARPIVPPISSKLADGPVLGALLKLITVSTIIGWPPQRLQRQA